ncbi:hypothetical protein ACQP2F_14350 [Actinoplanes sp. CA-030573]|uniref:hypothetical protein n=1 Tax=Actinoplanes sp. CA-030573 TaxID=3239898 RepID=UPI003D92E93F
MDSEIVVRVTTRRFLLFESDKAIPSQSNDLQEHGRKHPLGRDYPETIVLRAASVGNMQRSED